MAYKTPSEIAALFLDDNAVFVPFEIPLAGTLNTLKGIKYTRGLTEKMCDWVYGTAQREWNPTVQISTSSEGNKIVSGSFTRSGIEHGFTMTVFSNGAGKIEYVVMSMKQTMEESISIYNITLLFMIAADEARYAEEKV